MLVIPNTTEYGRKNSGQDEVLTYCKMVVLETIVTYDLFSKGNFRN